MAATQNPTKFPCRRNIHSRKCSGSARKKAPMDLGISVAAVTIEKAHVLGILFAHLGFQSTVRHLQAIAPVTDEELFFRGQKCVRLSEYWPQGRRHLQRHEQEDDDPRVETSVRPGVRVGKSGLQKPQPENGRDEPEDQMQRSEEHTSELQS